MVKRTFFTCKVQKEEKCTITKHCIQPGHTIKENQIKLLKYNKNKRSFNAWESA